MKKKTKVASKTNNKKAYTVRLSPKTITWIKKTSSKYKLSQAQFLEYVLH